MKIAHFLIFLVTKLDNFSPRTVTGGEPPTKKSQMNIDFNLSSSTSTRVVPLLSSLKSRTSRRSSSPSNVDSICLSSSSSTIRNKSAIVDGSFKRFHSLLSFSLKRS